MISVRRHQPTKIKRKLACTLCVVWENIAVPMTAFDSRSVTVPWVPNSREPEKPVIVAEPLLGAEPHIATGAVKRAIVEEINPAIVHYGSV